MLFTYVCGPEGRGARSHHRVCLLAISCIKAHGIQCSEENAGNMTEMTILVCIAVQATVQLHTTNACRYESTMDARCSCSAYTPLLRRSRLRCETGVRMGHLLHPPNRFWLCSKCHTIILLLLFLQYVCCA